MFELVQGCGQSLPECAVWFSPRTSISRPAQRLALSSKYQLYGLCKARLHRARPKFFSLGRAADTLSGTVSTWYTSSLSSLQAPAHSAGRGGLGRKYYPCVLEALTIQLSLETSELSTQALSISQRALNARGGLFHTRHEDELEDEDDEDDSGALLNLASKCWMRAV